MLTLAGVALVIVGLMARLNPVLVVTSAALLTGLASGLGPVEVISALGKAFNDARFVSIAFLVLPVVGLAERAGLQVKAKAVVARLRHMTVGRLLLAYLLLRQVSAALGLLSLGGQANMVRPLIAPMAEAEDEARHGAPDEARRQIIRAHAAAADNIGAFFGEDIFIALGSVLLVTAVLRQDHLPAQPLRIALWAIPTAIVALVVHAFRLWRLDRRLADARGESLSS